MAMATRRSINKDENFYKRVLNRSHQRFLEDLDPVSVLDLFLEKDYLLYTQVRDIQEQRLTSDKTREIIKKVGSKGVQGYKTFKAVLRESHQEHLAEFLDKQERILEKEIQMAEKEKAEKHRQARVQQPVAPVQTGNKRIPGDKELLSISTHVGMNWEMLGPFLGVPTTTVDQIKLENSTIGIKIYRLFFVWRGMRGSDATVENLLAQMKKAPSAVNIDWAAMNETIKHYDLEERTGNAFDLQRRNLGSVNYSVQSSGRQPGQSNLTTPYDFAVPMGPDYFKMSAPGTVTRGELNIPLGAVGGGEGSSETIHSSQFLGAFGNTRKQGKNESNLQAVDKSYSINSPDEPVHPQQHTAGNSIIYSRQPEVENRNDTVDAVRDFQAENEDLQGHHAGRPTDPPNLVAHENYNPLQEGIRQVEAGLNSLKIMGRLNQPLVSSNVTAVGQRPPSNSSSIDVTDARREVADGELGVKREKMKLDLPGAPHDGRLLTPSVDTFKMIIDGSIEPTQKGGFGEVFFHKEKIPKLKIPAVVKRINCEGYPKHKMMSITNERLASRTMHFSIVPLLAMAEDVQNKVFYFLTPYLEKGDLADAIKNDTIKINERNDEDVLLKRADRVRILYQINSALQFLHTPIPGFRGTIVHMDLKALNIVLDCNLNARLIDFGLAREMNETDTSLYVTATEVPGSKGYYQTVKYDRLTPKEDYHNFGVVIRELLTGKPAFDEFKPNEELRKKDKENIYDDIQSIWCSGTEPSEEADELNEIADQCIEKDIESKDIGEKLEGFLRKNGWDKWKKLTTSEDYDRCEMCMANPAVNKNMPNVVYGHECNCRKPMLVCIACMRNSFLNPMMCHSCGAKLIPCIGHGWGAVLIAGNDTEKPQLAEIFSEEISDIHNVVVSKCPLVMGISEDNIKVVKPTKAGEREEMLKRVDNAFDELSHKGDIHTLLIYYTGHHYPSNGFLLGSEQEFLSVDALKLGMKKVAESYSLKEARSEHISKIRFMVFLDCCAAPEVTLPKLMDNTDFSILQMNSSRSNQTAQADEIVSSVFTKFFIQAFTRCALHKPCINDNCNDCNCLKGEYITAEQLFEYISKHMAVYSRQQRQQTATQPVKSEQSILWHDLIIGYNIDFQVDLEFKVKGYEGKETVAQQIYTDMCSLRSYLFEKLIKKMKSGQQFDLNQVAEFAECLCIEIDRGPNETEELDSIEKVMAAWNSRRELVVSLRDLQNIHRGIVRVETPVADIQKHIEQRKPKIVKTDVLTKMSFPFASIDGIIKDLKYSEDSVVKLKKSLVDIRQGIKNAKDVVKDKETELHFIFPKPLSQTECVTFMCFQVTGLKEKKQKVN